MAYFLVLFCFFSFQQAEVQRFSAEDATSVQWISTIHSGLLFSKISLIFHGKKTNDKPLLFANVGDGREINGFSSNFLLSYLNVIAALVGQLWFVQKQKNTAHFCILNLKITSVLPFVTDYS